MEIALVMLTYLAVLVIFHSILDALSGLTPFPLVPFKRLGKFLVYDVYTRLFPKQFYKLVVLPLKDFNGMDEATLFLRIDLYCHYMRNEGREVNKGSGDMLFSKKDRIKEGRFDTLARIFEYYLHGGHTHSFWVAIIESTLGYYSHNLLMSIKPFQEEILKNAFWRLRSSRNHAKSSFKITTASIKPPVRRADLKVLLICFPRISPLEIVKNCEVPRPEIRRTPQTTPKPAYAGKELCNGTKTKSCKEKGNGNHP